jgi:hypothetical protein
MDPMIAKAKRRRNDALSTPPFAYATARILIPARHPAASQSFEGARDTDDFRHLFDFKVGAVYGAIAASSSRNPDSQELPRRCCAKATFWRLMRRFKPDLDGPARR